MDGRKEGENIGASDPILDFYSHLFIKSWTIIVGFILTYSKGNGSKTRNGSQKGRDGVYLVEL
jgi:hypothetical protein